MSSRKGESLSAAGRDNDGWIELLKDFNTNRLRMESALTEIRNQQKASWNKFSSGWKKWDAMAMDHLAPIGLEMIKQLDPKNAYQVLDVAAGTGEPGLTIASMIPNGRVIITDLAEGMLTIAHKNARARGIDNIETLTADVSELPFNDESFDAVSCRLGFMFFPDIQLAAKEMVRVLKTGHRFCTTVWAAREGNPWLTIMMDAINSQLPLTAPAPGAPGIFRCATPGFMESVLTEAGINDIATREVKVTLKCKTADAYWRWMTEVATVVAAALSNADDTQKQEIKRQVYDTIAARYPEGDVNIEGTAIVISGTKQLCCT
jgi:ubiquinone/menaquinone biosynthesis C-methylase UbiE